MRKLASPSNTDTIETCDTEQRHRLRAPLRRHLKPLLNHSSPAAEIEPREEEIEAREAEVEAHEAEADSPRSEGSCRSFRSLHELHAASTGGGEAELGADPPRV